MPGGVYGKAPPLEYAVADVQRGISDGRPCLANQMNGNLHDLFRGKSQAQPSFDMSVQVIVSAQAGNDGHDGQAALLYGRLKP